MTTQPAPTTVEAPQATGDAATCPTQSTALLGSQTPLTTVIQSSPSSAASTSVINPASAPSIDTPDTALATTPITDIGLSTSKPTAVGGEQRNQDKGNVNVVMSILSHTGPTASISAINPASTPSHNAPGAVLTTPSITDFGLASKSTVVSSEQLSRQG